MNEPDRIGHPIARLMSSRSGHFLLESGHHGSLWLDLEVLCLDPAAVRPFAVDLAARLKPYDVEAVCGPLIEGAFVALMVASELGLTFAYSERLPQGTGQELFRYPYRIPGGLRPLLRDRRVAIVNDVIGAGSAVRGTLADLERLGAADCGAGQSHVARPVCLNARRKEPPCLRDTRIAAVRPVDPIGMSSLRPRRASGRPNSPSCRRGSHLGQVAGARRGLAGITRSQITRSGDTLVPDDRPKLRPFAVAGR